MRNFCASSVILEVSKLEHFRSYQLSLYLSWLDDSIPTVSQELLGLKNLCLKSIDIIKRVADEMRQNPNIKWLVIADDDTQFR